MRAPGRCACLARTVSWLRIAYLTEPAPYHIRIYMQPWLKGYKCALVSISRHKAIPVSGCMLAYILQLVQKSRDVKATEQRSFTVLGQRQPHLEDSNGLLLLLSREALAVEGGCHVSHDADVLLCAKGVPHSQLR